jgi:hypothetical protein
MPTHRGFFHTAECLRCSLLLEPGCATPSGRWCARAGAPSEANGAADANENQCVEHLAYPFPAIRHPKVGIEKVPHQFGSPEAHVIARLARTAADDGLELRPLLSCQSARTPWNRGTLQTSEPSLVMMCRGLFSQQGLKTGILFSDDCRDRTIVGMLFRRGDTRRRDAVQVCPAHPRKLQ